MILYDQLHSSFEVEHEDFKLYDLEVPKIRNFLVGIKVDGCFDPKSFPSEAIEKLLGKKIHPMIYLLN